MSKSVEEKLLESGINIPTFSDCKKNKRVWFKNNDPYYKIAFAKINKEELELLDNIHDVLKSSTRGRPLRWSQYECIFQMIEDLYSKYNRQDIQVPSAPDTSKYLVNKAGWLKFDKSFSVTEGYCQFQRYFHYGIKIGGNFNWGEARTVIKYIFKAIEKYYGLPTYSDGSKPSLRMTSGTNWSAVGIG